MFYSPRSEDLAHERLAPLAFQKGTVHKIDKADPMDGIKIGIDFSAHC